MHRRFIEDIDRNLETMARLPDAQGESLEEQVHIFRKLGKRVRALLELFYPGQGGEVRRFRRKIAEVARSLSHSRDRHVALETAKTLLEKSEGPALHDSSRCVLVAFIESLSLDLAKDADTIHATLIRSCQRIEKLRNRFPAVASSVRATKPAIGLLHSYRLGRSRVKPVSTEAAEVERFHDLRKITKQLGYQLDWMEASKKLSLTSIRGRCEELGDLLGTGLDLKRLAEQFEEWLVAWQHEDGQGKSVNTKFGSDFVSELFGLGMVKCHESTNFACRLYFESSKSFGTRLELDEA